METHSNPIFQLQSDPTFAIENLKSKTVHMRKKREKKREIRDLRRQDNATKAIEGWHAGLEVHGFTKGGFSLIDLITAILNITGPASVTLSTWTAASVDVTRALELVDSGLITDSKWIVDLTFQNRSPELAQRIRDVYGLDSIRIGRIHSKYAIIQNDEYDVLLQTSMNLNFNPRHENFTLMNDPELVAFYMDITNELFKKQPRQLAYAKAGECEKFFKNEM